MPSILISFLAVVLVGAGVALETPTNALLSKSSGSALMASLISFIVGGATLGAAALILRPKIPQDWMAATPWYGWTGGLYGAFIVIASAWAIPKLGAGTTLVLIVAGQVLVGVVLDHFAVLGLSEHPASWLRIAGVLVVVAGAAMVAKG